MSSFAPNIPADLAANRSDVQFQPVEEQILQNMLDVLDQVRTPAFYTNFQTERSWRLGNVLKDNLVTVSELDATADEGTDDAPNGAIEWRAKFAVLLMVFESESSTYPARRRLKQMSCDAHRALMNDYQRGGLAVDTKIIEMQWVDPAEANGATDARVLIYEVQYRHDINDMRISR